MYRRTLCDYGPDGDNAGNDIALVGPLIGRSKSGRRSSARSRTTPNTSGPASKAQKPIAPAPAPPAPFLSCPAARSHRRCGEHATRPSTRQRPIDELRKRAALHVADLTPYGIDDRLGEKSPNVGIHPFGLGKRAGADRLERAIGV